MNIIMSGCATGTGRVVRENLLKQGHKVFGIGKNGPDAPVDFLTKEQIDFWKVFSEAEKAFGGNVDCLVNNAGMLVPNAIEDTTATEFRDIMRVNFQIPYSLMRTFVKFVQVREEKDVEFVTKRIINVTTMGLRIGLRNQSLYIASKAALEAVTKSLAKEFAGKYPIIIVAIAPGGIQGTKMEGDMLDGLQKRGMEAEEALKYLHQSPLGVWCTKEEVWKSFDFCINHTTFQHSGMVLTMPGAMGV